MGKRAEHIPQMQLNVQFTEEWAAYFRATPTPIFYELWAPGSTEVYCFGHDGSTRMPYEYCGLDLIPPRRKPLPRGKNRAITFRDAVVGYHGPLGELCLRVYMHHHGEPHHVAGALLHTHAEFASALYSHGDVGHITVPIYGYASLGELPLPHHDPYHTPIAQLDVLKRVFKEAIWPDTVWLSANLALMPPFMQRIATLATYSSIPTLPVFSEVRPAFANPAMNNRFFLSAGADGSANWSPDRGGGAAPCTSDWLEQRILETLMLSGLHSRANWEAEGFTWDPGAGPEDHYRLQFVAVVQRCLLGDDPLRPGGRQRGRDVLHAWARFALNAVLTAIGSHVSTRRYVCDHRDVLRDGRLEAIRHTDEFTLGFSLPGDCEDSNSTVYFICIWILRQGFATDFLRAVQACVAVMGMPCCVVGSSSRPTTAPVQHETSGHLFGLMIPHRIFAPMVWHTRDHQRIRGELNAYLESRGRGQRVSEFVYDNVQPHIIETIARTSAEYVDRDVLVQDNELERFEVYLDVCKSMGLNPVLPKYVMATYPLALVHTEKDRAAKSRHGFLIHGNILRLFAGAIPILFSQGFRQGESSQEIGVAAPVHDLLLERTIAFIPVRRDGRLVTMPTEYMHLCPEQFSLVSMTRVSPAIQRDIDRLTRRERPFVPLTVQPPWSADISGLLARTPLRAPPAEFAKDAFTIYIYADRVREPATHALVAALEARYKGVKSACVRRWGWSVALVLNFV